jgi:O-antigen/teichoic acid export membrane protein
MLFVPGSLWAIYYARQIILLLFHRADYLAAVPVFRIFQVTLLFFVANTLLGTGVLVACRRDRTFRMVLGGTAAVFLLLCPLFAWQWGIEGAAVAVLGTQVVSWIWLRYETRELVPHNSLSALGWPLTAGIVVITACSSLHLSLWSGVLVLVFAQFCLLLKRSWEMQGAQTSNA